MGIDMVEGIEIMFRNLKDSPLLIFLLSIFCILAYVIIAQQKTIKDHLDYERQLGTQLDKNSNTLVRLTALIEILVHGKGGKP